MALCNEETDRLFVTPMGARYHSRAQMTALFLTIMFFFSALESAAQPSDFNVTCRGAADIRQILVVAPGNRGKACDVVYAKNRGATSSTPYFADSDVSFCFRKAAEMRDKLRAANYTCEGSGTGLSRSDVSVPSSSTRRVSDNRTAQAQDVTRERPQSAPRRAPDVPSINPLTDQRSALSSARVDTAGAPDADLSSVPAPGAPAPASGRDEFLRSLEQNDQASQRSRADAAPSTETVSVPSPRRPSMSKSEMAMLQSGVALAAPTPLTEAELVPDRRDTETIVDTFSRGQSINTSDAGKIIGATPVVLSAPEERPIVSIASTEDDAAPVPETSSSTLTIPDETDVSPRPRGRRFTNRPVSSDLGRPRTRPEIIIATLAAQAAAWNEGDIDAYMEGYWRNPDLRFVSGTEVTTGWLSTLRRYKKRYGTGSDLGYLAFSDLEVEMVADDVAIVVGRFHLDRAGAIGSGVFTLVMKQFEGAWRIVHDHTVADQTVIEAQGDAG